jgi:hypothetical protein
MTDVKEEKVKLTRSLILLLAFGLVWAVGPVAGASASCDTLVNCIVQQVPPPPPPPDPGGTVNAVVALAQQEVAYVEAQASRESVVCVLQGRWHRGNPPWVQGNYTDGSANCSRYTDPGSLTSSTPQAGSFYVSGTTTTDVAGPDPAGLASSLGDLYNDPSYGHITLGANTYYVKVQRSVSGLNPTNPADPRTVGLAYDVRWGSAFDTYSTGGCGACAVLHLAPTWLVGGAGADDYGDFFVNGVVVLPPVNR